MIEPELPYTTCTDPLCEVRTCTPCALGITSCCRRTVICPTTRDVHVCPTQRGK